MAKKARGKTKKKASSKGRKSGSGKKASPSGDFYGELRSELEQAKSFGGSEFWKVPEGKSVVRPFPFIDGDGKTRLFVVQKRHWLSELKTVVACLGDVCPICDFRDELSKDERQEVRVDTKFLVNLVVRQEDNIRYNPPKAVIGSLPKTVVVGDNRRSTGMGDFIASDDDDVRIPDALDPKKGHDFKIMKSGKGLQTRYQVVPVRNPTPIMPGGVSPEAEDLTKFVKEPDQEELETMVEQLRKVYA